MATNWTNLENDPLNSGTGNEATERDRSNWNLVNSSNNVNYRKQHLSATGDPSELAVLPGDIDLLPQEIQSDRDEWELINVPS